MHWLPWLMVSQMCVRPSSLDPSQCLLRLLHWFLPLSLFRLCFASSRCWWTPTCWLQPVLCCWLMCAQLVLCWLMVARLISSESVSRPCQRCVIWRVCVMMACCLPSVMTTSHQHLCPTVPLHKTHTKSTAVTRVSWPYLLASDGQQT